MTPVHGYSLTTASAANSVAVATQEYPSETETRLDLPYILLLGHYVALY
jgi:hypothetical protein